MLSSSFSFRLRTPSPSSSNAFRASASPRLNCKPMLSKSCSMPMNCQRDSLFETKLMISLILRPLICLRARTKSRLIFSAIALFFSAICYSLRLYSAWSLFCSFESTLNLISSLSSSLRLIAASRFRPCPLILAMSFERCNLRRSSFSLSLLFRSSLLFCLVSFMIKLVSSAFSFSAFAFSTTF